MEGDCYRLICGQLLATFPGLATILIPHYAHVLASKRAIMDCHPMRLLGLVLNTNFTQSGIEMSKYKSLKIILFQGTNSMAIVQMSAHPAV